MLAQDLQRPSFVPLHVERIYAPTFSVNAKSQRAAEKIGMSFEGILRSSLELRGRRWDEAVYSILRADPR
jgi:ribosomal-protein-alanine N-acetyltransferase